MSIKGWFVGDEGTCEEGFHRFKPRYDRIAGGRVRLYVRDICIDCGRVVERGKAGFDVFAEADLDAATLPGDAAP